MKCDILKVVLKEKVFIKTRVYLVYKGGINMKGLAFSISMIGTICLIYYIWQSVRNRNHLYDLKIIITLLIMILMNVAAIFIE